MVDDRSVRNWINAFNDKGVDGLIVNKRPGRTAILKGTDAARFEGLIAHPEKADREFWTAKAFHGYISETYAVECGYQTVVRFFHKQGYALRVPQPFPDRQDEQLRHKFIKELEALYNNCDIDIWFQDESGFEGNPRPRRRCDKKGSKSTVVKNGDHLSMNVMGMVCPRTGEFFALETSHSNADTFQAFLDEASESISFSHKRNILIMDNTSWHKKRPLIFINLSQNFYRRIHQISIQ